MEKHKSMSRIVYSEKDLMRKIEALEELGFEYEISSFKDRTTIVTSTKWKINIKVYK